MLKKIDHIGIAVADLEAAIKKYAEITGQPAAHKEIVPEHKVATAFFPIGETRLELLKGIDPDSSISKFVDKRGEGFHHICFEVENLDSAKQVLLQQGLQFIENASEQGAGGSKIAFIHPKSTGGILMELVEYPQKS